MCGVELLRIVVRLLEFVRGAFFDKLSTGRTAAKYWGDESASATCNPSVKPATAANPPPRTYLAKISHRCTRFSV
jgi:hypothetical protein